MPLTLALNIAVGAVLGAAHCMLIADCEADFAEQTAAAALRALGVDADEAKKLATRSLGAVTWPPDGLFAETIAVSG
jgi:hypothetical protein